MPDFDDQYIIQRDTIISIADAVREMRLHNRAMTPAEIADEIERIHTGEDIQLNLDVGREEWARPSTWPDLDSIVISDDFDGVYMTYDLSKTPGYGWIGIFCRLGKSGGTYNVERGHLENGVFVPEKTVEVTGGTYFREPLDESNGMVQLWRVSSGDGQIKRLALVPNTATSAQNLHNATQPMVERRGYLPYVTDASSSVSSNATYGILGTYWLERDNLVIAAISSLTTIANMYTSCYRLRVVNLDWKTDHWRPSSLQGMFLNCYLLREVDFSSWKTSDWKITSLSGMFQDCRSLRMVDFTSWDTSNWNVTTLNSFFKNCISLCDASSLNAWNTSGWAVTNIADFFNACMSLQELDLPEFGWDTSNWAITSMSAVFAYCFSLRKIDLSVWNTSNWTVTTINSLFRECYSLLEANLSIDTANWNVTNMAYAFMSCESLRIIDLSGWDTSHWAVGTAGYMFQYCYTLTELVVPWNTTNWMQSDTADNSLIGMFQHCRSLKELDLSVWDTSTWKLKNANAVFANCRSLEEIKGISTWETDTWILTTTASMFERCENLRMLDLSGWVTSGWALTTVASMFAYCRNLSDISSINAWDTTGWALTTMAYMFLMCSSLKTVDLSAWDASGWNVTSVYQIIDTARSMETFLFPENLSLASATNTNYVVTEQYSLKTCNFYSGVKINLACRGSYMPLISRESLLALVNKLPSLTVSRTLTLQQQNRLKLTPEEIAIATQKGWTVA